MTARKGRCEGCLLLFQCGVCDCRKSSFSQYYFPTYASFLLFSPIVATVPNMNSNKGKRIRLQIQGKRLAVEVSDLCQYVKFITRIFLYSPHARSALHSRLAHRYEFLQVLHLRTKRCLSVSELSHLKGEYKYCN